MASSEQKAIEQLEEILSVLRHHLGNSVSAIKITLNVLQENFDLFDEDKKKEYLKRITDLLVGQERLVKAMKSFSLFNVSELREIKFISFWEHLLALGVRKSKEKGIDITYNLKTGPLLITGNDIALEMIMSCILDNAMDALEDIKDPRIELQALSMNDFVMVQVKDNGSGIKQNDLSKIFIPLFTTKKKNMGMGLSIVFKLLAEMEGRINIESRFGNGTIVKIRLKIVREHE